MTRGVRLILTVTVPLAAVILVATLLPSDMIANAPGTDKFQHFIAFGALAFPAALIRPRWAIWSVLATIAYGGLIEVIQPWFGRSRDLMDWRADAIGAVAGAAVGIVLHLPFQAVWRRLVGREGMGRA